MLCVMVLLAVAACGDDDDAAQADEGAPTASTSAPASTPSTTEPAPDTTEVEATTTTAGGEPVEKWDRHAPPPDESPVTDGLGAALNIALRGGSLPQPDATCVDDEVERLTESARTALKHLSANPLAWGQIADDDALALAQLYVGCADDSAMRTMLALSVVGYLDEEALRCVELGWRARLTSQNVASSLAYGNGLDDLSPEILDQLVDEAVACGPDEAWWIDELALELDGELEPVRARCVAAAYVDRLGVEAAVARRLLTLPVLALAPDQRTQLDLLQRCGFEHDWITPGLGATRGQCLAGFGRGTDTTSVADCAGEHNAEVVATHDLAMEYAAWPGASTLRDHAIEQCSRDEGALAPSEHIAAWDLPGRYGWETGHRVLTCAIVLPEYAPWVGATGLVPAPVPPESTTTTVPATTTTTPPPLAVGDSAWNFDLLVVGQCLYGPGMFEPATAATAVVTVAACTEPHHGEVFHISQLDGAPGSPYPGDSALEQQGDDQCYAAFAPYVGTPYEQSRLFYTYYYPDEKLWNVDDRTVLCMLHEGDYRELTVPMAGSGQ